MKTITIAICLLLISCYEQEIEPPKPLPKEIITPACPSILGVQKDTKLTIVVMCREYGFFYYDKKKFNCLEEKHGEHVQKL